MSSNKIKLLDSPDSQATCFSALKNYFGFSSNNDHYSMEIDNEKKNEFLSLIDSTSDIESINSVESSKFRLRTFNSTKRLKLLRSLMKKYGISTYIVPSEDEHQSEYTSAFDQRREFISGFTGSSGIAIITMEKAALSTDGRYFIQAENQLDDNWTLLKQGVQGYPTWVDWMIEQTIVEKENFNRNGIIAVDPKLIGYSMGKELLAKCFDYNLNFNVDLDKNLIDLVKSIDKDKFKKPVKNLNSIFVYELEYSGEDSTKKVEKVREFMRAGKCFAVVVSMLDEIAWLLNLRGSDITFNPVFFSYVIVTFDKIKIYVDKKKLRGDSTRYLNNQFGSELEIKNYKQIWFDLPGLLPVNTEFKKIGLCNNPSYALFINLPSVYEVIFRSIVTEFKGIKNETEIKNNKIAQLKDSVALIQFFGWFEEKIKNKIELSEIDVVNKTNEFRSKQENFMGLSFSTIASTGRNSAIVHYEPTNEDFSIINPDEIFLLDSGAQYLEGTTDITRTVHFGKPTSKEKKMYTLVLKGHLNVALLKFKKGTSSYYIDSLARKPLIEVGCNYNHGTGHGIDNFICVHSGPCGLSPVKTSYNYKPLEEGNFISDEPGYYEENNFGIRIESDILVVDDNEDEHGQISGEKASNMGGFLKFDYFTMVPFCLELIDTRYLEKHQIDWINKYHEKVRVVTQPYLEKLGDARGIFWLKRATREIIA